MNGTPWLVAMLGLALATPAEPVRLSVEPQREVGRVDEKIYGHFLEHIYHSANGGLWGDLVWNRSFEEAPGGGGWRTAGEELLQTENATDVRLVFGEADWGDLEYTVEARKDGGDEGFLLLTRYKSPEEFYWLNLGGWRNARHGLERSIKRADGSVQRTIVGTAEGRIDTDRWYRLRARLEGPRLRFWIDDELLLDYTDDGAGALRGQVGLGSWATSVRYRNIRVTDLDGKVLFAGLPPAGPQALPRHWQATGGAFAGASTEQAFNGRRSLRVGGTAAGAGVRQGNFPLQRGQRLSGSLYVRGDAPAGLVVRLLNGERTVAQQKLPAPTAEWQEVPLALTPSASADDGTLAVTLAGPGEISLDQISLMPDEWARDGGFRPDLVQAVRDLRAPIIRWPGGAFAEFYRWQSGIGPQSHRSPHPFSMWDDVDTNSLGTDEFIDLCRRVGAEPWITINIGRHDKQRPRAQYIAEALAWMEYCNGAPTSTWGAVRAANGHPEPYNVKYWEIDNESWIDGTSVEWYIDAVKDFAPAMRAAWPEVTITACGSGGLGNDRIGLEWNRAVIAQCADLVEHLSIHHYEGPDFFAPGPGNFARFIQRTAEMIAASANPALTLFVSEWNAQSTDWRTGLYAGGILNVFESEPSVAVASPALFLRHVSARDWDNAFINFDQTRWFPAPNYVVMKLYRDHFGPRRVAQEGELGSLNVVTTASADGSELYLKIVNPSDQPVDVEVAIAGRSTSARGQIIAPDSLQARNTLQEPNAIRPAKLPVRLADGQLSCSLPRWSVAVITVELQQ